MATMRLALVYQAGIANVFEVSYFDAANPQRREACRVMQADFRTCENFAKGAKWAGASVRSYACNRAGDITDAEWSERLEDAPFSDQFHPIIGPYARKG